MQLKTSSVARTLDNRLVTPVEVGLADMIFPYVHKTRHILDSATCLSVLVRVRLRHKIRDIWTMLSKKK